MFVLLMTQEYKQHCGHKDMVTFLPEHITLYYSVFQLLKRYSGNKCDKEHIFSWNYIRPWGQKSNELQLKCKRVNKLLIYTSNV